MRFVSIGKPHVHHERISIVGAFNPISARLWFQFHRDESHFPRCPMVAKNLRLEGTSALRSGPRRRIAPRTQSKRSGFVPRGTQSLPPAGRQDSFSGLARADSLPSQNAPAVWSHGGVGYSSPLHLPLSPVHFFTINLIFVRCFGSKRAALRCAHASRPRAWAH
jgi:hypothetical protein